jgi:hypothetical protein
MTSTNHVDDHATCSEHLTTIAFPEKRAAKTGDHALCKAEKRSMSSKTNGGKIKIRTIIPGDDGCNYAKGLIVHLRLLVAEEERGGTCLGTQVLLAVAQ